MTAALRRGPAYGRVGHRVVARLALVATAGLIGSACTAGSASSSHQPRDTSSTTSHSAPSTSSTSTEASGSTSTSGSGLARCTTADLAVSLVGTLGGAGTFEDTFALQNTSPTTCVLGGYPGLQLVDSSGTQLPTTVDRGGSLSFENIAVSTVTLPHGATAWFNLGYSDVPTGTGSSSACTSASAIWITPPGDTTHASLTTQLEACANGTLNVSPVFGAGSTATQTTAPQT